MFFNIENIISSFENIKTIICTVKHAQKIINAAIY